MTAHILPELLTPALSPVGQEIHHIIDVLKFVGWCQNKEEEYSFAAYHPTAFCIHGALSACRISSTARSALELWFQDKKNASYVHYNDLPDMTLDRLVETLELAASQL